MARYMPYLNTAFVEYKGFGPLRLLERTGLEE
jgi:hypothetical protein